MVNVVELPAKNIQDIPEMLRQLADSLESAEIPNCTHLAWVCRHDNGQIRTGFFGASNSEAVVCECYWLLGLGMRGLD